MGRVIEAETASAAAQSDEPMRHLNIRTLGGLGVMVFEKSAVRVEAPHVTPEHVLIDHDITLSRPGRRPR